MVAWLCLLAPAWAQPVADLRPIELAGENRVVPLENRARYWVDPAAQATPDAIEAAMDKIPWSLREAGTGYRIDGAALWFQFDAINRGGRWYLEVGSSGVDRAQLFRRGPDGRWIVQEAGDTLPVSLWPLPGRLPTFELSPPTDQPVRYWLRITHDRVDFASPLRIYDQAQLIVSREKEQFLLGGYFGLALLIAVVSIANAIVFRDRNFAAYAVYVGALAVGQLAYLGVGAQHLWNDALRWNEMASFILPGLSGAAALWFTQTVTEPARYSRALDLAVWGVLLALLASVAVDTVLTSRLSLMLMVALTSIALLIVAMLIGVVWARGEDPHVRLIALGFLPVLVMAIFPLLRGFNLIPVSPLTRYGVSIGAALEMPILFYALSLRGSRRREARMRAAALSRNDALTGLAHSRTLLKRLEAALARCATLKHTCGLLGVKIANQEAIVEEYGRETADRALVVAASLLRGVIADVDMAARIGDNEFVLLLEGPTLAADINSRAQRLVASGLRPSETLPPGLVLKFQVAMAALPDRGLDAEGSLRWLQDGVNAMRSDARKMIRALNF